MTLAGPAQRLKLATPYIAIAAGYFVTAKIGLMLGSSDYYAGPIWIPSGIAIGALIVGGYRFWPAVFVGALLAMVDDGSSILFSLVVAVSSSLEGLLGAYLVNRFARGAAALEQTSNVIKFAFFSGVVAPFMGATIGVGALMVFHSPLITNVSAAWVLWWGSGFASTLVIAPVILAWYRDRRFLWKKEEALNALILAGLITGAVILSFSGVPGFAYIVPSIFVWGAFHFRQRGMTTALLFMAGFSLWGTVHGLGPAFLRNDVLGSEALFLLSTFLGITSATMLALTATVVEHGKMQGMMLAHTNRMSHEKAVDAAILSSIGDGLVVTDHLGNIVLVNPIAESMLRRSSEEMVGRRFDEVIPMQDEDGNGIPAAERPMAEVLKGKRISTKPLSPTRYYVRKDGTRFPISFTKTPVVLGDGVIGAIEVFRDVTTGKEIDRAKSDFVSLASHQLRTPLSIISMYSELLKKQGTKSAPHNDKECREYADEIHDATKRMAELITDLLNVSRIDAQALTVAPRPVKLDALVDDVLTEMQLRLKGKRLTIERKYDAPLLPLVTDAQLFRIVIQNVVSNAVKYTPPDGKVTIDVSTKDGKATLCVADTGYGIPLAQQPEVFKKLFRADNARKMQSDGSGLGLYIAKSMVERLGGEISFTSEENKGSAFLVELPLETFVKGEEAEEAHQVPSHSELA